MTSSLCGTKRFSARLTRGVAWCGAAFLCALAGCMSQPYRGQVLFTLDGGAADAAAQDAKPHAGVLRVRSVSVAQPYASGEFTYRYADGRMRTDPYGGFIAPPQALITSALVDRLGKERTFETVVGPDMGILPAHEIMVSISCLCAVFNDASGTAQIQGTAFLMDPTADSDKLMAAYELSASAPIAGDNATAVAEGLNAALAIWLGDLSDKVRAATVLPLADTLPKAGTK